MFNGTSGSVTRSYPRSGKYGSELASTWAKSFLPRTACARRGAAQAERASESEAELASVGGNCGSRRSAYWRRPRSARALGVQRRARVGRADGISLQDKPSIAVLPFRNMSGDPEQEYFLDGITEDVITDLSKLSSLFVVARNSTFTYKGKPVKIRQVAEELGVRYVLEGSVRRAGDQVRITAQLLDATTGGHVWAERYDGALTDVFALQDDVTQRIV